MAIQAQSEPTLVGSSQRLCGPNTHSLAVFKASKLRKKKCIGPIHKSLGLASNETKNTLSCRRGEGAQ